MLTLILMRHAQAEPAAIDGSDFDRPLTDAGRREVLHAAQKLHDLPEPPQRVLLSPAQRTLQTADMLRASLPLDAGGFVNVDALYLATPAVIRQAIAENAAASTRLLVIGHNPGISELAAQLLPDGDGFTLPTAALCRIELPIASWDELRPS